MPRDAEIVRHTWQYVNKDGTADRRFNKNRRFPVCRYGCLHFTVGKETNVELQTSNKITAENVYHAYENYRSYVSTIGLSQPYVAKASGIGRTTVENEKLWSVYEEYNNSMREIGRMVENEYSQGLFCRVSFVDGQYYDNHCIYYYKASEDISNVIFSFEKALNRQLKFRYKLNLVSNDRFLVHMYMDLERNVDFSQLDLKLSSVLSEAMKEAENWSAMHEGALEETAQKGHDATASIIKNSVSDKKSEDESFITEKEMLSHFSETDSSKDSEDNSLINDMLMFLDED